MEIKYIDWPKLINHLMEVQVITQKEFGRQIKITQQSISNMCNLNRNPGTTVALRILKVAAELQLEIEDDFRLSNDTCNLVEKKISFKSLAPDIKRTAKMLHNYYLEDQQKCKRIIRDLNRQIDYIKERL